jgi:hypothetical protein
VISGNTYYGVAIRDAQTTGNVVAGNYIGTNAAGGGALANDTGVVILDGPQNNTLGGTTAGARNVISGNTSVGVHITGGGTTGNTFAGNYIGTTAAGSGPLANGTGVLVDGAATNNSVGGTSTGARNLISGNAGSGVHIAGPGTSGNTLAGDFIGTNPAGSGALANSTGVLIEAGASKNLLGGTSAGARNLISGNANAGVWIFGSGTSRNVVAGNFIGTTAAGSGPLANSVGVLVEFGASANTIGARNLISGNTLYGVSIDGGASGNIVQGNAIGTNTAGTGALPNGTGVLVANGGRANRNRVGGTSSGTGNTIAFNDGAGVSVDAAVGVSIQRNSIEANGGLGIELLNGGNNAQAPPEITAVLTGGTATRIEGFLNSAADTGFRIELFASPDCDPSGSGEGQRFLGFVNVTTDFFGSADFVLDVPAIAAGEVVTATATNLSSRDSSEFSLCAG